MTSLRKHKPTLLTPTMQALLYQYGFDSVFAREKFLQLASPIVGRRVLDIGTGSGWMAAILAQNGFGVVSIDVDTRALRQAERQIGQVDPGSVRFVQADASALPFASGAFNAVFSFESMHHVSDCQRTVQEMLRVCAPQGVVAIADLNDKGFDAVRAVNLQAGRSHQENKCRSAEVSHTLVGQGYQPDSHALEFVTVFLVRKPTAPGGGPYSYLERSSPSLPKGVEDASL